jgi:NADH-quinone oxidoreductase subunit N
LSLLFLFFFATLGLFILCFSNDLITSYLAIELQSLAFYVMATSKRNSSHSIESGLKYFVLVLFHQHYYYLVIFIFGLVGSVNFEDFKDLFFWSFSANSSFISIKFL